MSNRCDFDGLKEDPTAMQFPRTLLLLFLHLSWIPIAAAVAPLIGDVPDQVVSKDTSTGPLYVVVGDMETAFTALSLTASSSNPMVVPSSASNLTLGGFNAQRSITVTPAPGQTGTSVITLSVTDGESLVASSSFSVTVTPPNSAPVLSGLAGYQIARPGAIAPAMSFTVGDADHALGSLGVTATSSNPSLIPDSGILLAGEGTSRTVQLTPLAGVTGSTVIRLKVSDPLGASAVAECVFSVFDADSANNSFKQPRGIYLLDSIAGSQIGGVSMRDANVRNLPFIDGYALRTEWSTLEPSNGVYDFTIISNLFTKLPSHQKLSLLIASGSLPAWLNSLPGVSTYTAGSPAVTRPLPWDAVAQERYRLLLVALGNHVIDGVPLRDHPRLAVINPGIPGLKGGIREPDEIRIRNLPGYTRSLMRTAVLKHLANCTDNFPNVPVQIGFWTYTDATSSPSAWEELRQEILAQHNGILRPRVGFWMENLAASRPAANAVPSTGLPNTTYAAPLHLSQNQTFVGYQVLGSWSRPFSASHVDNNLNGSPEDGMDYAFNTFQCRYFEHYQADVDFAGNTAEFQRWHDFLNALPVPSPQLLFSSSQGGNSLNGIRGSALNLSLTVSGGTAPYTWTLISGSLPAGVSLGAGGELSGTPSQSGDYLFGVQATDANGNSATAEFSLTVASPASVPTFAALAQRETDGRVTLTWPTTPGAWYQVEASDDLQEWQLLANSVRAVGNSMNWTDDGSLTGSHPSLTNKRFYRVRNWGIFDVAFTSTRFTYTDSQRSVTGLFRKPSLPGRLPALIINHGTGGTTSPNGFTDRRSQEMSPWGLFCIGPDLTHAAGEELDPVNIGYSPENLARNLACVAVLATRSDVDLNRLALWGHSRGSFTSVGVASVLGDHLTALGFSAGGVREDDNLNEESIPSISESQGITAPTILFHGSTDTTVLPALSLRYKILLDSLGITNERVVYDTTGFTPANAHSIQNVTALNTAMLASWRAWLETHGVLP